MILKSLITLGPHSSYTAISSSKHCGHQQACEVRSAWPNSHIGAMAAASTADGDPQPKLSIVTPTILKRKPSNADVTTTKAGPLQPHLASGLQLVCLDGGALPPTQLQREWPIIRRQRSTTNSQRPPPSATLPQALAFR